MDSKSELATRFLSLLHGKQFDQAKEMLVENASLTVPQLPNPIQGRDGVVGALKMASDGGQGMDMVGFGKPVEEPDGSMRVAGRAPEGALWLVAFILRKAQKVTVTLRFTPDGLIDAMGVTMG